MGKTNLSRLGLLDSRPFAFLLRFQSFSFKKQSFIRDKFLLREASITTKARVILYGTILLLQMNRILFEAVSWGFRPSISVTAVSDWLIDNLNEI